MSNLRDTTIDGDLTVDGTMTSGSVAINEDGLSILMTNKTGLDPETQETRGVIVQIDDTTDYAVKVASANSELPFGVIRDSGVDDGYDIYIKILGAAYVLLKDSTGCTKGQIAYVSDTAGRAASTSSRSTAGYKMIGYFLETIAGGTDVLAKIMITM